MVDWKMIKDLHVIKKLEEILGKWFGVDVIFADNHGRVQSDIRGDSSHLFNPLFKVQMAMDYGNEYFEQDLENIIESVQAGTKKEYEYQSFWPGVRGLARPIFVDGEFIGTVIAFPFVMDTFTTQDFDKLSAKLAECNAGQEDISLIKEKMIKINETQVSYMRELLGLLVGEVSTFHLEITKREERIQDLNSELTNKYRYHNMIGKSKKMQVIYRLLERISNSESTILIQGENGTGKELVAKAIHYNSPRKDSLFIAQNCSAFNDNLLDSELFGHVKGAFTGAIKDKKGLFETANGGTLFLDEIGDTSLTMQVKLLRVLQEGTFLPVGATSPRKVNVRVIAATNRILKEMIAKGEFREDLYYRINVINIALPPLRERKEDVSLLVDTFLEQRCAEAGMPLKTISKKCMEKLLDYHWPGNVRELENEIERLVVLAGDDKMITPDMLSSRITEVGQTASPSLRGVNTTGTLKQALEELELLMIQEGLKRCNFNKSKLAKELGISRAGLIMKVDKYGLDKRKKGMVG